MGLPRVNRMEYLLEFRYPDKGPDGRTITVTDPGNPEQAPGAFGPKSVLEFPSYRSPGWLTARRRGPPRDLRRACRPLPLLVAHDGPEYDALASLTRYLAAGVAGRWLPRMRAALLSPGPRDRWYSANTRYARALAGAVLPALARRLATSRRIGMGASLGGLAMLHLTRLVGQVCG